MARLEKQAEWLERGYPSAATSLREGLAEMSTVSRMGLSPSLSLCLVSTNVIESPHSGIRLRTRKVCRWRDGKMALRWAAAALLMTGDNFRRIMGYRDLWMRRQLWVEKKCCFIRRSRNMNRAAAHLQRPLGHLHLGQDNDPRCRR